MDLQHKTITRASGLRNGVLVVGSGLFLAFSNDSSCKRHIGAP